MKFSFILYVDSTAKKIIINRYHFVKSVSRLIWDSIARDPSQLSTNTKRMRNGVSEKWEISPGVGLNGEDGAVEELRRLVKINTRLFDLSSDSNAAADGRSSHPPTFSPPDTFVRRQLVFIVAGVDHIRMARGKGCTMAGVIFHRPQIENSSSEKSSGKLVEMRVRTYVSGTQMEFYDVYLWYTPPLQFYLSLSIWVSLHVSVSVDYAIFTFHVTAGGTYLRKQWIFININPRSSFRLFFLSTVSYSIKKFRTVWTFLLLKFYLVKNFQMKTMYKLYFFHCSTYISNFLHRIKICMYILACFIFLILIKISSEYHKWNTCIPNKTFI